MTAADLASGSQCSLFSAGQNTNGTFLFISFHCLLSRKNQDFVRKGKLLEAPDRGGKHKEMRTVRVGARFRTTRRTQVGRLAPPGGAF